MRYWMYLLYLLVSVAAIAQPTHRTGANFNPATLAKTQQKIRLSTRSLQDLPSSYSLEEYCPTPGNQGDHGTCVAFANGYDVATILYAKTHDIKDKALIDKYAFSAMYLYNQIKSADDNDCQNGADPVAALLQLKAGGDALQTTVPYQCDVYITDDAKTEAQNYRIREATVIFAAAGMLAVDNFILPKDEMIEATKKALVDGYPVSSGWRLPESFFHITSDVWYTTDADTLSDWKHNGHAMAIVGYDDNKAGGSFRVLNSWGTGWADGGFIWVRYNDFAKWCVEAFEVFADPLTLAPIENKFVLSGSVEFKLSKGETMSVSKTSTRNLVVDDDKPAVKEDLVAYTMASSYASGTRFKFYLNVDHEAYVYAFATDLSGKVNLILPYDDMISTHVGASSTIAFPSDTKSIKLDENKGTDYLLILYSAEKLDAKDIAQQMNNMNDALSNKIKTVLGDKLIDKNKIKYSPDAVAFSVNGTATRNLKVSDDNDNVTFTGGTVVPLMVEIKHD